MPSGLVRYHNSSGSGPSFLTGKPLAVKAVTKRTGVAGQVPPTLHGKKQCAGFRRADLAFPGEHPGAAPLPCVHRPRSVCRAPGSCAAARPRHARHGHGRPATQGLTRRPHLQRTRPKPCPAAAPRTRRHPMPGARPQTETMVITQGHLHTMLNPGLQRLSLPNLCACRSDCCRPRRVRGCACSGAVNQ